MPDNFEDLCTKIATPYLGASSTAIVLSLHDRQERYKQFGDLERSLICAPEDVIFEIGSITKVFTALLLAILVDEGEIDPDRPIRDLCEEFSEAPIWITPRKLATHTSGLPRLHLPIWKAILSAVPDDPYGDFSREDMAQWLRRWKPKRPPKETAHTYSNLGFGLLGEVLAICQGQDYPDLLQEKILSPLALNDTAIELSDEQQNRFAQPRNNGGKSVKPWTFKAMAGAGALRSSARDLVRFSSRIIDAIEEPKTSIDRSIVLTASPAVGLGPLGNKEPVSQCMGWLSFTLTPSAAPFLFHDGGTAGSTAAIYICSQKHAAIAVLANRGVAAGLWSSLKLGWSNPHRVANNYFASL